MRMSNTLAAATAALTLSLGAGVALAQDTGDTTRGEVVAKRCIACHSLDKGGPNKVGPNLYGVMSRNVASVDGFKYSDDLLAAAEKQEEWTEAALMDYLADPTGWIRAIGGDADARGKMTFKLGDEQQRRDVIAYLQTLED